MRAADRCQAAHGGGRPQRDCRRIGSSPVEAIASAASEEVRKATSCRAAAGSRARVASAEAAIETRCSSSGMRMISASPRATTVPMRSDRMRRDLGSTSAAMPRRRTNSVSN